MEIGNQQGRILNVDYNELMFDGLSMSLTLRSDFTLQQTQEFILNINQKDYNYFFSTFGLTRDQTKLTKRKVFDLYEKYIPNGFTKLKQYPDYAINVSGTIIRIRQRNILRQSLNQKGYPTVCLTDKMTITVHRLVATTFIPNPENKPEVNHINAIKIDNNVSNLEWVTTQENIAHKTANNLGKTKQAQISATGQNNSQAKLLPKDIFAIRASPEPYSVLAKIYNVSVPNIYAIKKRRSWKHI